MSFSPATIGSGSVVTSYSPCRVQACDLPKGKYEFTDSDLVFNVQLRHRGHWHRDGIRLSDMLRKANEKPGLLRNLLTELGFVA